jgi:predicted membrane channel-forming protein YqfA (hemolysin III family)
MKKYIGNLPLLIIAILMSVCIYTVMTSNLAFSYEHYIGLIGIIFSIFMLFVKPAISKLATGIVLLLGTFSFAAFTSIIEYHRIGFSIEGNGLDIKLQPYCLLILLLFVIFNLDFIKNLFKRKQSS